MPARGSPAAVLEDRPDLADPLSAVLAVDERNETWTFDDLPIDSGPFGELVSRDVVESVGEEYRLAEPEAVRRALDGGSTGATTEPGTTSASDALPFEGFDWPSVDRRTAGFVAAAIGVVALFRLVSLGSVYRGGHVVLSGNDPYAYRYYVEQVAAASAGPFDVGALDVLPSQMVTGEPLMVATLWWVAELLGGTTTAIGHVMAWYPVVSAVVTAGLVYLLAVKLTADRRVGLASVLFFAIVPGHALRTSLGFADHHAFDYPWLAATALLLVVLAGTSREDLRTPRTWLASALLGLVAAGQVLAWDAGPLLFGPIGLAVVATSAAAVADDRSPLPAGLPVVAGLALASLLTVAVHLFVGWHTTLVASAPAIVLVGVLAVLGLAVVVRRTTGDVRHLLGLDVGVAVGGVLAATLVFPTRWAEFVNRLDALFRSDAIAETAGLFNLESVGFLLLLGFTLVLAVPTMVWAIPRVREDVRWGVAAAYAWYFLVLAGLQVRFVGELAVFAAVFAGLGFVRLAAWIDAVPDVDLGRRVLAPIRTPSRGTVVTLGLLFLLVGSLGIVQVPVKTSQVTIGDDVFSSAMAIEERSTELGQEYPENRVLTDWGRARMVNYFVNGESSSYGYSRQNYEAFASGTDPDSWYSQFDGRVGYVVMATTDDDGVGEATTRTAIWRLTNEFGSATESTAGVGHYRAISRAPGGTQTAFAVVPGAQLSGTAEANETVRVSTDVSIPNAEFTYSRAFEANATGAWSGRVAYPGTYSVGTANATVDINPSDVRSGANVSTD